jgi:two-component system, OmpR family, sensor histidine kinase KdpD
MKMDQETENTTLGDPGGEPGMPLVRVMVAIGINPNTERLLLRAARLAKGLQGELYAIHIQPSRSASHGYQANLEWHLQQARRMGAHVEIVHADDIAAALVQAGRQHNITHLVLGQSDISRWQEAIHGSIVNRLLRFRSGIDIYIVTDPGR